MKFLSELTSLNEANLSDEQAAKKIFDKIKGTPNLTLTNIEKYVARYLDMVGKSPKDIKFISANVLGLLQDAGLHESVAKNVKFKLEIPKDADDLLALSKSDLMRAIEGEEEGDNSFIQNQTVVTVEYITRHGNEIHVYPAMDVLDVSEVSHIAHKLQRKFTDWCLAFDSADLAESYAPIDRIGEQDHEDEHHSHSTNDSTDQKEALFEMHEYLDSCLRLADTLAENPNTSGIVHLLKEAKSLIQSEHARIEDEEDSDGY